MIIIINWNQQLALIWLNISGIFAKNIRIVIKCVIPRFSLKNNTILNNIMYILYFMYAWCAFYARKCNPEIIGCHISFIIAHWLLWRIITMCLMRTERHYMQFIYDNEFCDTTFLDRVYLGMQRRCQSKRRGVNAWM